MMIVVDRKERRKKALAIRKKLYFTLIELLIAISIIGISVFLAVYPMKNSFLQWRYRKGLEELSQVLLQAKFLSICYGTDCHVVMKTKDGDIEFWIESLEPLNPRIKKHHSFHGVKKILCDSSEIHKISFYASGFHTKGKNITIISNQDVSSDAVIELSIPFSFKVLPQMVSPE